MIPGERSARPGASDRRPSSAVARTGPAASGADDGSDTPERRARQEAWRGLDESSVMSAELITSTLLWFGIGWMVDRLLGTMPWFTFAGALLGNWTGLYLLWLRGQRNEADQGPGNPQTAGSPAAAASTPAPAVADRDASPRRRTTEVPHEPRAAGERPDATAPGRGQPPHGSTRRASEPHPTAEDTTDDDD